MPKSKSDKPQAKAVVKVTSVATPAVQKISVPLSSKGQLVIPKEVRDQMGWKAGTQLDMLVSGTEVKLALPAQEKKLSMDEFLLKMREWRQKAFGNKPIKIYTDDEIHAAFPALFAAQWEAKMKRIKAQR